ncbi:hypothetical protein R6Q59_024857 [Mikania micrantha]
MAEQRSRRWAIPDDESDNWSKDVIELFNNGDASFCYFAVFYTPLKLDQLFWGTLLGYMGNGYLSAAHVEGWVGRMMNWRSRQVEKKGNKNMRWTILPPRFYDFLVNSCNKRAISYANGKLKPFPSFLDVDYVIFPFCIQHHDWSLARIDLRTCDLEIFLCESFDNEKFRQSILPNLRKISVYFIALLVNICYWKKSGFPEKCLTNGVNEDYIQSHNELLQK